MKKYIGKKILSIMMNMIYLNTYLKDIFSAVYQK